MTERFASQIVKEMSWKSCGLFTPSVIRASRNINLLALDFDGVLTDNFVYVASDGNETVKCSKYDSMGLKIIKEAGIDVLCISSELNPVVAVRCCKLGIRFMAGIRHKAQTLAKIMPTHNHHWATTAYIGNDVNDLDCIKKAALSFCPYDAPNDIREEVDFITDADHKAGSGAVRQVCEFLLQARVKLTQ